MNAGLEPPVGLPYYGAPWGVAVGRFWKKGFTFSGRASPSEYWKATLTYVGLILGIAGVSVILISQATSWQAMETISTVSTVLIWGFAFVAGIPQLALVIRRLHDTGRPGMYVLISFIPFVGELIVLVFLCQAPNPAGTRFDKIPTGLQTGGGAAVPGQGVAVPPMQANGHGGQQPGGPAVAAPSAPPAPQLGAVAPPPPPPPAGASNTAFQRPFAAAAPFDAPAASATPAVPLVPASTPTAFPPNAPASASGGLIDAIPGVSTPRAVPQAHRANAGASIDSGAPGTPSASASQDRDVAAPFEGLEPTRLSGVAAPSAWTAILPDRRRITLTGVLRLGRNPALDASAPRATLLSLDDPAKSISKTHAQLETTERGLLVTDLHSTNGTRLLIADGVEHPLDPGVAREISAPARIRLGDYVIQLEGR